jgi:hypothetical protein
MEWILQVADDIDDAIGALRLSFLGLAAEVGLLANRRTVKYSKMAHAMR